jgi:hypothetical protein
MRQIYEWKERSNASLQIFVIGMAKARAFKTEGFKSYYRTKVRSDLPAKSLLTFVLLRTRISYQNASHFLCAELRVRDPKRPKLRL